MTFIFLNACSSFLFTLLHAHTKAHIIPLNKLCLWITTSVPHANLLEATFVPSDNMILIHWLEDMLSMFFGIIQ